MYDLIFDLTTRYNCLAPPLPPLPRTYTTTLILLYNIILGNTLFFKNSRIEL